MINGNRGEWSEYYAFLRILADGRIVSADADLNELLDSPYIPVIKAIRQDKESAQISYLTGPTIVVKDQDETLYEIDSNKVREQADLIYEQMTDAEYCSNGTLAIPCAEEFMQDMHVAALKAPASSKTDITLQIHDSHTGTTSTCGWSIKSEIGGAPTLLNAGGTTNFTYRVTKVDPSIVDGVNAITGRGKVMKRVAAILDAGGKLEFSHGRDTFMRNLRLIDSLFPQIMAKALLIYYGERVSKITEVVKILEDRDPLELGKGMYEFKFKKLLASAALGMIPSDPWNGHDNASGGYIIVRRDGKVVAFHIYNRGSFENYLFENTKFETASTSRHRFGSIEQDEDGFYINLNCQIRFIDSKPKSK